MSRRRGVLPPLWQQVLLVALVIGVGMSWDYVPTWATVVFAVVLFAAAVAVVTWRHERW